MKNVSIKWWAPQTQVEKWGGGVKPKMGRLYVRWLVEHQASKISKKQKQLLSVFLSCTVVMAEGKAKKLEVGYRDGLIDGIL